MSENGFQRERLTKSFFFQLPEGRYLVSNVYWSRNVPVFAEYVAIPELRGRQWQRIKEAGADHGLCNVFESEIDYRDLFIARSPKGKSSTPVERLQANQSLLRGDQESAGLIHLCALTQHAHVIGDPSLGKTCISSELMDQLAKKKRKGM